MLTELVVAKKDVTDWRKAVEAAGEVLVAAGAVRPEYVQAMVRAKEELGPYIVIAPGIAMPHARPESGVITPAVTIVTLADPVAFGHEHNDPVDIVIAFAAEDKSAHLETLKGIAELASDADRVEHIRAAATDSDLITALGK